MWQKSIDMSSFAQYADTKLGAQGRIVIPARIRKALGFRPGDVLHARIEREQLVIEKPEAIERRLQERFRRFEGRSLAKELIAERRKEARRESGE